MRRRKFSHQPRSEQEAVAFATAEEAWFWGIQCLAARADGARFRAGLSALARPCEPDDLLVSIEALVRDGVDDLDRPHVVITQDARTGCVMLQGPYPHAIDALRIAERDARWLDGDEESVVLRVAPLLPPTICWE